MMGSADARVIQTAFRPIWCALHQVSIVCLGPLVGRPVDARLDIVVFRIRNADHLVRLDPELHVEVFQRVLKVSEIRLIRSDWRSI